MNIEIIPVTAFQQNCSLIWDDDKNAAIIDSRWLSRTPSFNV